MLTYLILGRVISMVTVEPRRDCPVIVWATQLFYIPQSSSILGALHHCLTKSSVSIRETLHAHCLRQVCRGTVPSLYHYLREEMLSNLQPGWLWPQVQRIYCTAGGPPVSVTDLNHVSLLTRLFHFIL